MSFQSYCDRALAILQMDNDQSLHNARVQFLEEARDMYLPYDTPRNELLSKLRDVAMAKFILWMETNTPYDAYKQLITTLFTSTGALAEARLFASIPFFQQCRATENLWEVRDSLIGMQLIESPRVGDVSEDELKTWSLKLIGHPLGKLVLNDIVTTVGLPLKDFSPTVHFFNSAHIELWGFYGIEAIYINIATLEEALKYAQTNYASWHTQSSDCFGMCTKILVAIIGYTIATNCALRKARGNASEVLFPSMLRHYAHLSVRDPGLIAQVEVFRRIFAWHRFSSTPDTVRGMFQYFNLDNTASPDTPHHVDIRNINLDAPPTCIGIYKKPVRRMFI